MKCVIVSIMFCLSACVSSLNSPTKSISYKKMLLLNIGATTENEVVNVLGAPADRIEKNGYYTLNYNDDETGFQRAAVNFNSEKKMSGFLWIPKQNEQESAIKNVTAEFSGSNFKEIPDETNSSHSVSDKISLVDEKSGITIRYDRHRNLVEAIARYSLNNRIPASSEK